MIKWTQHQLPWYRTKAFYHYLSILKNGTPPSPANRIHEGKQFTEFKQLTIKQKIDLLLAGSIKNIMCIATRT